MNIVTGLNCPSLRPEQIQGLQKYGFKTFMDLILGERDKIMEAGSLTTTEFDKLQNNLLDLTTPTVSTASGMLQQYLLREEPTLKTGISGLDMMLGGGVIGGELIELYGESGSGRTNICIAICAQFCHKSKVKSSVVYFNLTHGFNAHRLLGYCGGDNPSSREDLRNVKIIHPSTLTQLCAELDNLRLGVSQHESQFYSKLKLVIIDSVPMAIYPAVDEDAISWRYFQEELIEKLVQLSKLNNGIVVVLVNQAVKIRHETFSRTNDSENHAMSWKPAMGMYWKHKVNFRIQLSKSSNTSNSFMAFLEKSSRTSSNSKFNFTIGDSFIDCIL